MSELWNSKPHFSSLLISDLVLLCSSVLSHPLYFSYFIFFAPYLLKLISFLSPLFITTFLLSLAFLAGFVHENLSAELSQNRVAHLLGGYNSVLERLRFKKDSQDDEFQCSDDLGVYEILFGDVRESPVELLEEESGGNSLQASDKEDLITGETEDPCVDKVEIDTGSGKKPENSCAGMEEKRLENFLKILDEFERMASNVEEKKKLEPSRGAKADKVVAKSKLFRNGSEAAGNNTNDADKVCVDSSNGGKESSAMVKAHSQRITSSVGDDGDAAVVDRNSILKAESSRALDVNNLGSYGSMRKEKEWKRTLACKLFEERHNVDGGEGMDSLWEAYEMDSNKATTRQRSDEKRKNKKKSNVDVHKKYYGGNEEEEEMDGQLCCLQALKLSAGKMNLGVGRPNLVKISKAIKGIGWLHHVTKHSKKVHNNGDRY